MLAAAAEDEQGFSALLAQLSELVAPARALARGSAAPEQHLPGAEELEAALQAKLLRHAKEEA